MEEIEDDRWFMSADRLVPADRPPVPVALSDPLAPARAEKQRTRALLAVADQLEALAEQRGRAARRARASWEGPHRHRFDAERANRDAAVAHLVARCRQLTRP